MILVVEKQKIIEYLLKPIDKADISKFLNHAEYNLQNWEILQNDIILQFSKYTPEIYENNEYGILYKIEGTLKAPLREVNVTTIWIFQNNTDFLRLVTLFPSR
jgi:YesN/AraC family two-component response regulator